MVIEVISPVKQTLPLKCSCHGKEIMAAIENNKFIIKDRRHGYRHLLILTEEEIQGYFQMYRNGIRS